MAEPRVADAGRWSRSGPAVLSYGFRPFFLGGAVVAAFAPPLWLAMLVHGVAPAGPFDALRWHVHEMIFGYLTAVIAGFTLTAVPNWTGRFPLSGLPLAGLVGLWILGRVASSAVPSVGWALILDVAFLAVLAAAVWREILAGGNSRNIPVALLVSLFALANLLFHLEALWPALHGFAERLALGAAALLIGLIGGRITPSFTRNWMARAGLEPLPVAFGRFDQTVLLASAAALSAWVLWPQATMTGLALVAVAALHAVRVARWRGASAAREPIVLVLHLGYLWLALSLALMGLATLAPHLVSGSTALHALSAGAIGTMTLAVMTRATLGHTGREIANGPATNAIYTLVSLGAALRLAAPYLGEWHLAAIALSAVAWSGAFGHFVAAYGPMLVKPGLGRL